MSAAARIKTRKPTGQVSYPVVLLEGEEKAGKTYTAYQLTGSDRVGRCFVIDLGEGSADEYAPLGDYEVVEHDGTFMDVLDQVTAIREFAREQADAGEKPVVLIIDSISDEWDVLRDGITAKAARSAANRKKLAEDPAAEVKVPNHLWNDANAKHNRLMTRLLTFPGIVVLTARGKEVAEIRNGAPVEGSKVWKVEGQKNIAYQATCWIRMHRNQPATLEGARSLYCGVRPGKDPARELPEEWEQRGLEWFIFDAYRLDPTNAQARDLRDITDDGEGLPELPEGVQRMTGQEFFNAKVTRELWQQADVLESLLAEASVCGIAEHTVNGPDGQPWTLGNLLQTQVRGLRQEQAAGTETAQSPPDAGQEPPQADQRAPQPVQDTPPTSPPDEDALPIEEPPADEPPAEPGPPAFRMKPEVQVVHDAALATDDVEVLRQLWMDNRNLLRCAVDTEGRTLNQVLVERQQQVAASAPAA